MKKIAAAELLSLLRDGENRIIASKTSYFRMRFFEKADASSLSDYDVFSALCDSAVFFAGHPIRAAIKNITENAGADFDSFKLQSEEYRKLLWQSIFLEERERTDFIPSSVDFDVDNTLSQKEKNARKNLRYISLEALLSADYTNHSDLFSLSEAIAKKLMACGCDALYFDVSQLEFVYTDNYHAEESYKRFKSGGRAEFELLFWLSCRLLIDTGLSLYLKVESAEKTEKILSVLKRLRISKEITVAFPIEKKAEAEGIFALFLKEKNLSLETYFSEERSIIEEVELLKNLYGTVPLGFAYPSAEYEKSETHGAAMSVFLDGVTEREAEKTFLLKHFGS